MTAYDALGCAGVARVGLLPAPRGRAGAQRGEHHAGVHRQSQVPRMFAAAGIAYTRPPGPCWSGGATGDAGHDAPRQSPETARPVAWCHERSHPPTYPRSADAVVGAGQRLGAARGPKWERIESTRRRDSGHRWALLGLVESFSASVIDSTTETSAGGRWSSSVSSWRCCAVGLSSPQAPGGRPGPWCGCSSASSSWPPGPRSCFWSSWGGGRGIRLGTVGRPGAPWSRPPLSIPGRGRS